MRLIVDKEGILFVVTLLNGVKYLFFYLKFFPQYGNFVKLEDH